MSLVSVIMNCHNGEKFLNESLKSVIDQTYQNWELIFFDNLSNDNSKKILQNYKDKRIKYYSSKKFLDLYAARNEAIDKSNGKYISFLDTDDYWAPNKLEEQIKFLESNREYKIVYSNYYIFHQDKKNLSIPYNYELPSGFITKQILKKYPIDILTTCIRKKIFEKKAFKTKYNIIGDFDFFTKLSVENKIAVIQRPLAVYRIHDDNFSSKRIHLYITELSRWLKINKKDKLFHNLSFTNVEILLLKLKIKLFFRKFLKINLGV